MEAAMLLRRQALDVHWEEYRAFLHDVWQDQTQMDALYKVVLACTVPYSQILDELHAKPEGSKLTIIENMRATGEGCLVCIPERSFNERARTVLMKGEVLPEGTNEERLMLVAAQLIQKLLLGGVRTLVLLTGGVRDRLMYGQHPADALETYLMEQWESLGLAPEDLARCLVKDVASMNLGHQARMTAHLASMHKCRHIFMVATPDHIARAVAATADSLDREHVLTTANIVPVCVNFWDDVMWRTQQGTKIAQRFNRARMAFGPATPLPSPRGQRFQEKEYADCWRAIAGQYGERWLEAVWARQSRLVLEARDRAGEGVSRTIDGELKNVDWPSGALTPVELLAHLRSQEKRLPLLGF